jgi:deoxyribodipyrimidine photolyase
VPSPDDSADLTARFNALREVLENEIRASQDLTNARMDGMDAARSQYLDSLQARGDFLQNDMARRFDAVKETLSALQVMLNERYATQTKALDAAFKAAEQAVAVALANAEKAVAKAETASDKRFESVNEFRQTLSDQTASFPSRTEVNAQLDAVRATGTRNAESIKDIELRFTSRLDLLAGQAGGAAASRTEQRLSQGAIVSLIAVALVFLGLIVSVVTLVVHH